METRDGSDIDDLLPPTFDPCSPLPLPPKAGILKVYTFVELQQSLTYAQKFLNIRTITPRQETFMTAFKDKLTIAMRAGTKYNRLTCIDAVRVMEEAMGTEPFVNLQPEEKQKELQEELLGLRQRQYYSRYGSSLKKSPTKVRRYDAEKKN